MDKEKLLQILDKHIDQQGLSKDLAIQLLLPFLQKIVSDSENKFDDVAFGWVKEYVEKM
jgi:hypothetical protein